MQKINTYISEKLHINNTIKIEYMYHPKDKDELVEIIQNKIDKEGLGTKDNSLDLNDIDTSKIENMSILFDVNVGPLEELSKNGYFNISDWNVSNVRDMSNMFHGSNFNGDLSKWDVSNVKYMNYMFAHSAFAGENGDISDWNVSNVEDMPDMFYKSKLSKNKKIPNWYLVAH